MLTTHVCLPSYLYIGAYDTRMFAELLVYWQLRDMHICKATCRLAPTTRACLHSNLYIGYYDTSMFSELFVHWRLNKTIKNMYVCRATCTLVLTTHVCLQGYLYIGAYDTRLLAELDILADWRLSWAILALTTRVMTVFILFFSKNLSTFLLLLFWQNNGIWYT